MAFATAVLDPSPTAKTSRRGAGLIQHPPPRPTSSSSPPRAAKKLERALSNITNERCRGHDWRATTAGLSCPTFCHQTRSSPQCAPATSHVLQTRNRAKTAGSSGRTSKAAIKTWRMVQEGREGVQAGYSVRRSELCATSPSSGLVSRCSHGDGSTRASAADLALFAGIIASVAYIVSRTEATTRELHADPLLRSQDPGNWATDLQAGSSYGYSHLFIILFSGLIALLFQILSTRLGCVSNHGESPRRLGSLSADSRETDDT